MGLRNIGPNDTRQEATAPVAIHMWFADGDGWADCNAIPACYTYGHACGDCNDHDPEVNPNQKQRTPRRHRHDHKDNDCNGVVDG